MAPQEFRLGQGFDEKQGLENRERSLKGKVALITGSGRDIGGGIAIALAQEGVSIIGNYREKGKRAEGVAIEIQQMGGYADFVPADITVAEDRERLKRSLEGSFGGKLDYLILNTSGTGETARKVCVEANNSLIDELFPQMNEGGVIILMQSVPGHFAPQLGGLGKTPSFYDPIAEAKYEGEQLLRSRIPEFQEKGVSLVVVCPPEVEDTFNMRLFRREDPLVSQKHAEISDMLGIPRAVSINDVGQKVVELLKQPNLLEGYTEFFGDVQDSQTALEKAYGTDQVYVNTFQRLDEQEGKKRGVGRLIVSKEQATRTQDPRCIDSVSLDADNPNHVIGELTVTENHMVGHFRENSGLPKLFPGHKQIRAVVETADVGFPDKINQEDLHLHLIGFHKVEFRKPVISGEQIAIDVYFSEEDPNIANAQISVDKEIKMVIENMRLVLTSDMEKLLLGDQVIEAMAQTSGITADELEEGKMPLFQSIGPTAFFEAAKMGDGVQIEAETVKQRRGFEGEVLVKSGDAVIAKTTQLRATTLPLKVARRLLRG